MNIIKSILLGSAAGILAMSGARAAKPIEYVKVYSRGRFYDTDGRLTPIAEKYAMFWRQFLAQQVSR